MDIPSRVGVEYVKKLLSPDARTIHLLAFGTVLGNQIWVSFVGGPIQYSNLPRQTFGVLQSKIFPYFFGLNGALSLLLVGTLAREFKVIREHPFDIFDATVYQAFTLATCALSHIVNGLVIGPASSKIMYDRHRQEREEGKDCKDESVSKFTKVLSCNMGWCVRTDAAWTGCIFWLACLECSGPRGRDATRTWPYFFGLGSIIIYAQFGSHHPLFRRHHRSIRIHNVFRLTLLLSQASDKMKTLNKEFASLHSISATLNLIALGGLAFHASVRRSFSSSLLVVDASALGRGSVDLSTLFSFLFLVLLLLGSG